MLCNRFFMEINTVMKQLKPQSIKRLSDDYTTRSIFIFILHWQNSLTACICISPQAGGKRAEYTVGGGGAAQADGYTATKLPRWISEWFCSRKKDALHCLWTRQVQRKQTSTVQICFGSQLHVGSLCHYTAKVIKTACMMDAQKSHGNTLKQSLC